MLTGKKVGWYLEILGRVFYASTAELQEYWEGLSEYRREEFLNSAVTEGAGTFCLAKLGNLLPEAWQKRLVQHRNQIMVSAIQREVYLRRLFLFLAERGIRFAPFKGADLAYRVYPSPSMRPYGDFDIFFHPDDIERARQELIADGWKELGHVDQVVHHHYAPLIKNKMMLEPHWMLSCFEGTSPLDVWKYVVPAKKTQHILIPELNILAFTRHASGGQYRIISLSKLLLDCAMVIQHEGCNWQILKQISGDLHQPYAGNLLAAFPEFFPAEMIEQMEAEPQAAQAYRQIFESRSAQEELNSSEVTVARGGVFTIRWWQIRFSMLHPVNVRIKYKLHKSGDYARLMCAYIQDISLKVWQFVRYTLCPRRKSIDFLKLIERAEKQ